MSVASDGHHFSEILANQLNLNLYSFGQPGASNYCIADQIESAIQLKPDLIIFNTTSPDRFVFNINPHVDSKFSVLNHYRPRFHELVRQLGDDPNTRPNLINLNGVHALNTSEEYLISLAEEIDKDYVKFVKSFFNSHKHDITQYLVNHYDSSISEMYNIGIICKSLCLLEMSKIPYICMLDVMKIKNHCNFLGTDNYILDSISILPEITKENKKAGHDFHTLPHYHTTQERQHAFSKEIIKVLEKRNLI